MNREHWLAWEDLTSDDIEELISSIHPQLVRMENKNFLNVASNFRTFLFQSFDLMIKSLEKILDPERKVCPKINQLLDYEDDIFHMGDSTTKEMMRYYGTNTVYATVENWWRYKAMILEQEILLFSLWQ